MKSHLKGCLMLWYNIDNKLIEKMKKTTPLTNKKSTPRHQVSKRIGINLSVSRVRKHVDKNNVNKDVESAISELKSLSENCDKGKKSKCLEMTKETEEMVAKAYASIYDVRKEKYSDVRKRLSATKDAASRKKLKEMAPFPVKNNSIEEKIDYVSKLRCRFSNDASVVLSSGLDYIVQELVNTAMVNARASGKAIIQVDHIVQEGFKNMSIYPLVKQLKVVQDAESSREHREEDTKKVPEKKPGNKNLGKEDDDDDDQADDVPPLELEDADVSDENCDDSKNSRFEFYINLICKRVKAELSEKDELYSPVRISKNIRKFCSDIVIQLIERVSPLVKLYAQTARVKTVNDNVIKFIFQLLLIDAGVPPDDLIKYMDDRLKTYREIKKTVS